MLISFSVENFKSFRERATISLLAHRADKTLPGSLISPPAGVTPQGTPLLPVVAIYGPNAGGKTNIIKAFEYLRDAVLFSQTMWIPRSGTRVSPHAQCPDAPSRFEVEFSKNSVRYKYAITVDNAVFREETLHAFPHGRERILFSRTTALDGDDYSTSVEFGPHFQADRRDRDSFSRRARPNSLLLSACAQENQPDAADIYRWFQTELKIHNFADPSPGDLYMTSAMLDSYEDFRALAVGLMQAADASVLDIYVNRIDGSELPFKSGAQIDLETFDDEMRKYRVEFEMEGADSTFLVPLENQSSGIKRLYAVCADLLSALRFGYTILVDELEASLHPQMAAQIMALFKSKLTNRYGAQLVYSTHETRFLNLNHLRRDEIWFVEKISGASVAYSLLEFSPRKDQDLEKSYLRGRFGAIPTANFLPEWVSALYKEDSTDLPKS